MRQVVDRLYTFQEIRRRPGYASPDGTVVNRHPALARTETGPGAAGRGRRRVPICGLGRPMRSYDHEELMTIYPNAMNCAGNGILALSECLRLPQKRQPRWCRKHNESRLFSTGCNWTSNPLIGTSDEHRRQKFAHLCQSPIADTLSRARSYSPTTRLQAATLNRNHLSSAFICRTRVPNTGASAPKALIPPMVSNRFCSRNERCQILRCHQ